MRVWTRKSALIQTRTSPGKSDVSSSGPLHPRGAAGPKRSDPLHSARRGGDEPAPRGPQLACSSPARPTVVYRLPLALPAERRQALSQLYQRRFSRPNTHFSAFFEIYKICNPLHRSDLKFSIKKRQNFEKLNIEYSIETAHFLHQKRYFSSKWR